jgi:hypothetical protein
MSLVATDHNGAVGRGWTLASFLADVSSFWSRGGRENIEMIKCRDDPQRMQRNAGIMAGGE